MDSMSLNINQNNVRNNYWYPQKKIRSVLIAFRVFFFVSIISGIPVAIAIVLLGSELSICLLSISYILYGIVCILFLVILYRSWKVIQDGTPRTTPGKAIGFLFIPFFNIYWLFIATVGLVKDMNKYANERGITGIKVSKKIALSHYILLLLSYIPFISILTIIPAWITYYIFIGQISKGTMAICNWKKGSNLTKNSKEYNSVSPLSQPPPYPKHNLPEANPVQNHSVLPPSPPPPPQINNKIIDIKNTTYHRYLSRINRRKVSSHAIKSISQYQMDYKIGSGGFATVYEAKDTYGRSMAIKLPKLLDDTLDSSIYDKFESESKIWKNLRHHNIVQVFDSGIEQLPFIAMELMDGGNLKQLMLKYSLTVGEATFIMLQVLDAISYAHRMASIHRDIKPENILFTSKGIPKITDWGIGKFMASESATKTMGTKGTLLYSAPEQISKKRFGPVDWSTDIFQLGVIFYEMLTGINPFFDEDSVGIIGKITGETPPPPSSINVRIPSTIDHIVMTALEKRKENRWRSVDIMYYELKKAVDN